MKQIDLGKWFPAISVIKKHINNLKHCEDRRVGNSFAVKPVKQSGVTLSSLKKSTQIGKAAHMPIAEKCFKATKKKYAVFVVQRIFAF